VKVQPEVTRVDEVVVDAVGDPGRTRRALLAGERPIEVPVVDREVPLLGEEAMDVEDGQADEGPVDVLALPLLGDLADDLDAVEFVAMDRRRDTSRSRGT